MHSTSRRMTRSEYLGELLMEFQASNRVFVELPSHSAKKSKANNVVWLLTLALSEVIGTAMLLVLGCSGGIPHVRSPMPSHIEMSVVFGLAVSVIVQVFGHISGAHINPSVTIAAFIFKLVSLPVAALYFVAQMIGGILGYGFLLAMVPSDVLYVNQNLTNSTHGFCVTKPNPQISVIQAFLAEYVGTAVLIFVCCSVWDKRNSNNQDSVPLKFGLTIMILATILGPLSGGSLNPARSFGPALLTGTWDSHWIYWMGPLSAAAITAYFYKFIFDRNTGPVQPEQSEILLHSPQRNSKVQNSEKLSAEDIATL